MIELTRFFKKLFAKCSDDNISRLSASLSFYTLFSIAPLLIIAAGIAGIFYKKDFIEAGLRNDLSLYIGAAHTDTLMSLLSNQFLTGGKLAVFYGFILLFISASAMFSELRSSLDRILHAKEIQESFSDWLKSRGIAFLSVVFFGLFVLTALATTAVLSFFQNKFPAKYLGWEWWDFGISILFITIFFGSLYKLLPSKKLRWRHAILGAFITSILFSIGKFIIAEYLSRSLITSVYQASGSIVIFLLWIYYSSHIFFLGAELTYFIAQRSQAKLDS